jgi:hypothetical protein
MAVGNGSTFVDRNIKAVVDGSTANIEQPSRVPIWHRVKLYASTDLHAVTCMWFLAAGGSGSLTSMHKPSKLQVPSALHVAVTEPT